MRLVPLALAITLLSMVQAAPALGQAGHQHGEPGRPPAGHAHGPGEAADAQAHQRVEAYLKEFDAVVADGRGFGLAFVADQNGYPGPLHVLELKDRLQLTPEQEARMTALFQTMLAEARAKAVRLAEAETRLRQVFAAGTANGAAVRAAVAGAEAARAEVRLVHLLTHLETRDLLTETQRRTYHRLRWGAEKNP
jgi:Spy/CpxP family protein refolding chaperone